MSSVNKVILLGRVGKDPETRYLNNGDAVTNLNLATSEEWKDKNGEKQSKTEWHRIVFYKKLAEIAGEYIKKGSLVYIEGRIETNSWKDKNGVERETKNIIAEKMKMVGGNRSNSNQSSREDFNEESSENIPF